MTAQYRSLFAKLQALAGFSVAKLLLTASLAKRLEKNFLEAFGLPLSTKILRAPSDQPHISFNQIKYSNINTKPIRLAIDIAKLMNTVMDKDQIGITFCTSKKEVDELENFTHCSSYSNHPFKAHNEVSWKMGNCSWIAATTGLIQGIDAPNVGVTIFIDLPYGLINLYQGSGRGGRDGRKCWSISIIRTNNYFDANSLKDSNDPSCLKESYEWQKAQQCRRLRFSQTLDGSEITYQDLPDCHLCDFCDIDSSIMATITSFIPDPIQSTLTIPIPTAPSIGTDLTLEEEAMFESFDDMDWEQVPDTTQVLSSHSFTPFTANPIQSTLTIPTFTAPAIGINLTLKEEAMFESFGDVDWKQVSDTTQDLSLNLSNIPTHLVNPSIAIPSLAICCDAIIYQHQRESKNIKANILNGKCPICWAHNANNLQPSHGKDKLFRKCNPQSKLYIPHLLG